MMKLIRFGPWTLIKAGRLSSMRVEMSLFLLRITGSGISAHIYLCLFWASAQIGGGVVVLGRLLLREIGVGPDVLRRLRPEVGTGKQGGEIAWGRKVAGGVGGG
ncbi:hypothetical protein GBA52_026376 [Prunus armeniaca]|nr:hypothetical protein GBA52_026376 [Prunus armeniaca]